MDGRPPHQVTGSDTPALGDSASWAARWPRQTRLAEDENEDEVMGPASRSVVISPDLTTQACLQGGTLIPSLSLRDPEQRPG